MNQQQNTRVEILEVLAASPTFKTFLDGEDFVGDLIRIADFIENGDPFSLDDSNGLSAGDPIFDEMQTENQEEKERAQWQNTVLGAFASAFPIPKPEPEKTAEPTMPDDVKSLFEALMPSVEELVSFARVLNGDAPEDVKLEDNQFYCASCKEVHTMSTSKEA